MSDYEAIGRGPDHEFSTDHDSPITVEVDPVGAQFEGAEKLVAKSVVALVKSGKTVSEAASIIGTTVYEVRHNSAAREALRLLRQQYELDNEELKQLVKVKAVELALQSEDGKLALDATKLIAQMPDVGLTQTYAKVSLAVGVFSDETNKVLASMELNEGA